MGSVDGLPAEHQLEQSLSSEAKLYYSFMTYCLLSRIVCFTKVCACTPVCTRRTKAQSMQTQTATLIYRIKRQ